MIVGTAVDPTPSDQVRFGPRVGSSPNNKIIFFLKNNFFKDHSKIICGSVACFSNNFV